MNCRLCGRAVPEDAGSIVAHARKHDDERKRLGFSMSEYELLCYSRMLAGVGG